MVSVTDPYGSILGFLVTLYSIININKTYLHLGCEYVDSFTIKVLQDAPELFTANPSLLCLKNKTQEVCAHVIHRLAPNQNLHSLDIQG
jgi:hypothetical protein